MLPVIFRKTIPKYYSKYLKFGFKNFPTDIQRKWCRRALAWLRHDDRLRPDGFMYVNELYALLPGRRIPESKILDWVRIDRSRRFEVRLERIAGTQEKTWLIRARYGHTTPGVSRTIRRISNPREIPQLVYITTPSMWSLIEQKGIHPDFPTPYSPVPRDNFIHFQPYLCSLFLPPATKTQIDVQLHITIDLRFALAAGILFFRVPSLSVKNIPQSSVPELQASYKEKQTRGTSHGEGGGELNTMSEIISTGMPGDRSIPSTFFKRVEVVTIKKEELMN